MDRERSLQGLIERLQAASGAQHWHAMASIDRELAQVLPRMRAQRAWSAREVTLLSELQRVHRHAYEGCRAENERLGKQIEDMQMHKEGWLAYAIDQESIEENR